MRVDQVLLQGGSGDVNLRLPELSYKYDDGDRQAFRYRSAKSVGGKTASLGGIGQESQESQERRVFGTHRITGSRYGQMTTRYLINIIGLEPRRRANPAGRCACFDKLSTNGLSIYEMRCNHSTQFGGTGLGHIRCDISSPSNSSLGISGLIPRRMLLWTTPGRAQPVLGANGPMAQHFQACHQPSSVREHRKDRTHAAGLTGKHRHNHSRRRNAGGVDPHRWTRSSPPDALS